MMSEQWPVMRLGDVCSFQGGSQPQKSNFIQEPKQGYVRLLQIRDFTNDSKAVYIPKELAKRRCEKTDIMIGRYGASVGQIHRGKEGSYNVALIKTIPDLNLINQDYFYYYLQSPIFQMPLRKVSARAAQAGFSKADINDFEIPLPSLDEQQRIIKILDESLGDIELNSLQIKKSINDSNEFFEATLNEIFTKFNYNWLRTKLKDITIKIGSGATPKGGKKSYKSEGVSLIRSMNIHDKYFKHKDLAFIDESQAEKLSNAVVESNDVLFNITGASVARCNLAPKEIIPARVNQHVMIIRPFSEKLNPKFLHFMLISKPYKDKLLAKGEQGGSTRQAITKNQVENFEIWYPSSMQEQKDISNRIKSLLQKSEKLENTYLRKLDSMSELKQSILQEAFNGNLTKEITA